jgi:hypothetical protein
LTSVIFYGAGHKSFYNQKEKVLQPFGGFDKGTFLILIIYLFLFCSHSSNEQQSQSSGETKQKGEFRFPVSAGMVLILINNLIII